MRIAAKLRLVAVVIAALLFGLNGCFYFDKAMAEETASSAEDRSPNGPRTVVLRVGEGLCKPAEQGTIWRYFETWRTDICKTDDGKVVPVDAFLPRQTKNESGAWDVYRVTATQHFNTKDVYQINPAKKIIGSPWPVSGWEKPEFDDAQWTRFSGPLRYEYRSLALMCLRGRFEVKEANRVADLEISLTYRGGVVVYLNGTEVGRNHLPKGKLDSDTLADDYPQDAFVSAAGEIPAIYESFMFYSRDPKKGYQANRARTAQFRIPASLLRKGTNVLAVEIHRASAAASMFTTNSKQPWSSCLEDLRVKAWWDRVALEALELSTRGTTDAIIPNVKQPKGFFVWNRVPQISTRSQSSGLPGYCCDWTTGIYYGDPNEPLPRVEIRGLKNGRYNDQIFVGCSEPINNLKAVISDLTGTAGDKIPSDAVDVSYYQYAPWWHSAHAARYDILDSVPPPDIKLPVQPIWVVVNVPKTASKGIYKGKLSITADRQKPIEISVQVEVVADWLLPDPQNYTTFVALLESPDTVAMWYKVPMWSPEHWKLLERAFEILGKVGNKEIVIPFIAHTHAGNACSMPVWVKAPDGSLKVDWTNVEKYLDIAVKHLGKVPDVCTIIDYWQLLHTERDATTGELKNVPTPMWGTPEALAFWRPVFDEYNQILAKRGLEKSLIVYGCQFAYNHADDRPISAALKTLAPQARFMTRSHVGSDLRENRIYCAIMDGSGVYWNPEEDAPFCGWREKTDMISFARQGLLAKNSNSKDSNGIFNCSPLMEYRLFPEKTILSGSSFVNASFRPSISRMGFGQWCADGWPSIQDSTGDINKAKCQVLAYSDEGSTGFQQAVLSLLAPGKDGPVWTGRLQMLREGLQDVEVRKFLQDALLDQKAKLGADLAARVNDACVARTWILRYQTEFQDLQDLIPKVYEDLAVDLYRLTDDVTKALGK